MTKASCCPVQSSAMFRGACSPLQAPLDQRPCAGPGFRFPATPRAGAVIVGALAALRLAAAASKLPRGHGKPLTQSSTPHCSDRFVAMHPNISVVRMLSGRKIPVRFRSNFFPAFATPPPMPECLCMVARKSLTKGREEGLEKGREEGLVAARRCLPFSNHVACAFPKRLARASSHAPTSSKPTRGSVRLPRLSTSCSEPTLTSARVPAPRRWSPDPSPRRPPPPHAGSQIRIALHLADDVKRAAEQVGGGLRRSEGGVRRQGDVIEAGERMVRLDRLDMEHVEPGAADAT
jgi:hypothetical protein